MSAGNKMDSLSENIIDTVKESKSSNDLPTEKQLPIQFITKFIFEILHFAIVVVPLIVHSIINNFLLQPKPVKDKVVLVS